VVTLRASGDGYKIFVRVSYPRRIMRIATLTNFKCPRLDCKTFYVVSRAPESPARPPRCVVCDTPFLAKDEEQYLSYLPTSSTSKITA